MMTQSIYITPTWPLQDVVIAGTTISTSTLAQEGFNLAQHVEDTLSHVQENRTRLMTSLGENITAMWLSQTHSNKVISATNYTSPSEADAAISNDPQLMPVVLTADCLPILLSDITGEHVAAIHAGWPGLYKSIIANTIANMPCAGNTLYAWIGPAISQANYEVDAVFHQRFININRDYAAFFTQHRTQHYLADLLSIARYQLQRCGLDEANIYHSDICSFADRRFFSYRRDGAKSGRMATFILPAPRA